MTPQTAARLTVCMVAALLAVPPVSAADLFPVSIHVDASATVAEQYVQLEEAGQLAEMSKAETLDIYRGTVQIAFQLPRQAVSLLVFSW